MSLGLGVVFALLALCPHSCSSEFTGHGVQQVLNPLQDEKILRNFVRDHLSPRGAVLVLTGKGRRKLFENLADDEELKHIATFVAQPGDGDASLTIYRGPSKEDEEVYTGKWSRSAIGIWLKRAGYAMIHHLMDQFPTSKYLGKTTFGAVLIVLPFGNSANPQILKPYTDALMPWAEKYQDTLKFSFFSKEPGTEDICQAYGIQTDDEIILLENPRIPGRLGDTHVAGAPKYRKVGVSAVNIEHFFENYEAGRLARYYRTSVPEPTQEEQEEAAHAVLHGKLNKLTSWDFDRVIHDPGHAVVLLYTTEKCMPCIGIEMVLDEVHKRIKDDRRMKSIIFAMIYQDIHEHSQVVLSVPSLQYWPWGRNKSPMEIKDKDAESVYQFLAERTGHLEL